MPALNEFDPNTGRRLNVGETVTDKASGRVVVQGTPFEAPADSSLKGTMTKTLPDTTNNTSTSRFANFRSVLKQASDEYKRRSANSNMNTTMGALGVNANTPMSGESLANIVNFAGAGTVDVKDIYQTAMQTLQDGQDNATRQLELLISQDALPQLDMTTLQKLSNQSGMDMDYILGIKKAQEKALYKKAAVDKDALHQNLYNQIYGEMQKNDVIGTQYSPEGLGAVPGKINLENWTIYKNEWQKMGGDPSAFNSYFSGVEPYELTSAQKEGQLTDAQKIEKLRTKPAVTPLPPSKTGVGNILTNLLNKVTNKK